MRRTELFLPSFLSFRELPRLVKDEASLSKRYAELRGAEEEGEECCSLCATLYCGDTRWREIMPGTVRYSQPRHTRGIISEAISPTLPFSFSLYLSFLFIIYIYISAAGPESVKSRSEHAGLRDCYRAPRLSFPPPRFIHRRYWSESGGKRDGRGNEREWNKRRLCAAFRGCRPAAEKNFEIAREK